MWLEEMLKNFKRILLMVSHSQDFMNGVCTNIIHMSQKQLNVYTGLALIFAPPTRGMLATYPMNNCARQLGVMCCVE